MSAIRGARTSAGRAGSFDGSTMPQYAGVTCSSSSKGSGCSQGRAIGQVRSQVRALLMPQMVTESTDSLFSRSIENRSR